MSFRVNGKNQDIAYSRMMVTHDLYYRVAVALHEEHIGVKLPRLYKLVPPELIVLGLRQRQRMWGYLRLR